MAASELDEGCWGGPHCHHLQDYLDYLFQQHLLKEADEHMSMIFFNWSKASVLPCLLGGEPSPNMVRLFTMCSYAR